MEDDVLRVVKIDKEAVYEFIYENFIANQRELLGVNSADVINNFEMDWKKGEFIFTAHKQEDAEGEIISLPKEIEIQELLEKLPITTDSVLSAGQIYKDYTFEEISRVLKDSR